MDTGRPEIACSGEKPLENRGEGKLARDQSFIQSLAELVVITLTGGTVTEELRHLTRQLTSTDNDIEAEIQSAIAAMQTTSDLVGRLQERLTHETLKLTELTNEVKKLEEAKKVGSEALKPLLQVFEKETAPQRRKERWIAALISLVIGTVLLVAGVLLSDPIKSVWAHVTGTSQAVEQPADTSAGQP